MTEAQGMSHPHMWTDSKVSRFLSGQKLMSKIQPDTAYQKQQETLIVWSEGDNFDLALSFQEKAGCDEIWEKICQVQGKDPSVDITQEFVEESEDERFEDMSDTAPPVELPACELNKLETINELIASCLSSAVRREKLSTALEMEGYIRKLLNLFHICEDLENLEGLHHLFEVFKNIFLLNKNALFEVMFAEDTIFDVVGCLEYDPNAKVRKRHRDYLRQMAKFKEVIPITNPELLAKIHQTYRVQYIQDVVLPTPSVFEENMLSTLSSFIFFNKVEIVSLIQDDEKFLNELFTHLTDETMELAKRRDLVLFLKEFCTFSQTLQPQSREAFFKTLASLGILPALEITLAVHDPATKSASIDILSYIVEFSPSMVRDYMLQQVNSAEDDEHLLLNIVIEQMMCDSDPELGGAVQLSGILRLLIDPENMLASINKSEKADFLNFFYKHSMHVLVTPLLTNTTGDRPTREDYPTVQLLGLILELLSFCVEHHTYHIKNYILNRDLLRRILVLMRSRHTFLVLSALRFLRKIISLKDEFYNRYIVKSNLLAPVVDAFLRNNGRYNLLDSAILELFEFIKMEDVKSLCVYVVDTFGKSLDKVEYVQTFKCLRLRYDQQQDRIGDGRSATSALDSVPSLLSRTTTRFRRDPRQLEEEEENYFNSGDDDEDENGAGDGIMAGSASLTAGQHALQPSIVSSSPTSPLASSPKSAAIAPALSPRGSPSPVVGSSSTNGGASPSSGLSPATSPVPPSTDVQSPSTLKKALVDYEGDSEEDEDEAGASVASPAVLNTTSSTPSAAEEAPADNSTSPPPVSPGLSELKKVVAAEEAAPVVAAEEGLVENGPDDDDDAESPNKRAKMT
uniref:EOG090X01QS n=1 Tax=Alona affinis TaxID=381656 RepID=A0A9N6ZFR7_9CRUS|nr:EOG090X01QS [Alona affinis]